MSFRMTSFEEIVNYFKLRNNWLNSKLCAYEIRLIGKLCTPIFLPNVDIFITALPRSYSRARRAVFFSNSNRKELFI